MDPIRVGMRCDSDDKIETLSNDENAVFDVETQKIENLVTALEHKKSFKRNMIFLVLREFLYLDEVYKSTHKRKALDCFWIDWMQSNATKKSFTYYIFKIRSKNIEELFDKGFMEWLEYTLLIFKGTRSNMVLMIDSESVSKDANPMPCQIARHFMDRRLSIAINSDVLINKKMRLPEDAGLYTIMVFSNNEIDPDCIKDRLQNENLIFCFDLDLNDQESSDKK